MLIIYDYFTLRRMSFFTKEHRALSPILIANSFLFFGTFIMIAPRLFHNDYSSIILKHKLDPLSSYGQTPVKFPSSSNPSHEAGILAMEVQL